MIADALIKICSSAVTGRALGGATSPTTLRLPAAIDSTAERCVPVAFASGASMAVVLCYPPLSGTTVRLGRVN